MRIIRGTKDLKGNVITKTPVGRGVGTIRCTKCPGVVSPSTSANGQSILICSGCGAQYQATAMDKPYSPPPGTVPRRQPR